MRAEIAHVKVGNIEVVLFREKNGEYALYDRHNPNDEFSSVSTFDCEKRARGFMGGAILSMLKYITFSPDGESDYLECADCKAKIWRY